MGLSWYIGVTLRLYDSKIVYINSHDEEYFEKINQTMDGIERYKELIKNNKDPSKSIEDNESQNKIKTLHRVLNPIKEGLSNNTLKILKAWLKTIKNRHFKAVGTQDKDDFKYIPTVWVLFEMKETLMISEQINTILFGMTYTKREGFLKSTKFQEIVDAIMEFEKKELNIDAEDVEDDDEDEEENLEEGDNEINENNAGTWKAGNKRRDEIARDVALFITKSNEKWILDQFNLWKKFLIQNSIEGNYDEFAHPVYENFEHIKTMKKKWRNVEAVGKAYKNFTELIKITQLGSQETVINKNLSRSDSLKTEIFQSKVVNTKKIKEIDLSVKKCDVHGLLTTIEEIENKVKLKNILVKTLKAQLEEKDNPIEMKKNARMILLNLSMLNYCRNYEAVKFSQEHPSDDKNLMSV